MSHETTFSQDIRDLGQLEGVALSLTEAVCFRLRRASLQARTLHLKVRYHDFTTTTRSRSLPFRTDRTLAIWKVIRDLMHQLLSGRRFAVRLIGVGASNFLENGDSRGEQRQADLVDQLAQGLEDDDIGADRERELDDLSDAIRQRFGNDKIRRGRSL